MDDKKLKLLSILSGGMDSTTALWYARSEGHTVEHAIHFQYGSKHNAKELDCVNKIAEKAGIKLHIVDLDFVAKHFKSDLLKTGGEIPEGHYADPSMMKTVVPFRNGIMLSVAAGLAESLELDGVILGNHAGDHAIYPDCRMEFTSAMAEAITLGTYRQISFYSPFVKVTKTTVAAIGHNLGAPLELTWSCYKGSDLHCGKCGTCYERKEAFKDAGIPDPTVYE